MSMPEGSLVAAVERMARALEQLAAASSVRAVLEEVGRAAIATLEADQGSVSWLDADGTLLTWATAGLPEDAAAACAVLLLRQFSQTHEPSQPRVVEELSSDALLESEPALRQRLEPRALVAFPLCLADGSCVGVLVGWFRSRHVATEDALRRAGLYARLAGIALGRERMMQEARRSAAWARAEAEQAEVLRISRFQAVTEGFSRALTRHEVARVVLDLGLPAVGALAGVVHLLTLEGTEVELMAAVGVEPHAQEELRRLPREGKTPGHDAARTAAAVWLASPEELRARYPAFALRPAVAVYQAFAFVPLLAEGKVLGVIAFAFGAPQRFSVPEQASILGLARQCGLALERSLLYEREHTARLQAEAAEQRLRLLADASALLSRSLEWEETVSGVARLAVGPFADWCAVDLLSEEQTRRVAVLHADPAKAPLAQELMGYWPDPARASFIDAVLRTGHSHLEADFTPELAAQRTSNPRFLEILREIGIRSFIIAPLVARQRILGALSFVRGADKPPYDAEDLALAEELASRAALAMDNARLFQQRCAAEEESRQSAARLHLLVQVSQLVAEAGLDLERVLDVLARAVTQEIGDCCLLQLVSEDGQFLELAEVYHSDAGVRELLEEVVRVRRLRVGEGLQGAAVSTGQTLFLGAMSGAALEGVGPEAALRPYFERRGPQDVIAVALVARGRACGSLLVLRDARGRPYGQDDQVLLESIASRAALAIEDARLYAAALEALRLRDDFLSVAGHELKNPLNALQLQLRVLARKAREERLSDSLAERAERVARTGERLGVLIEDLLDVSRITAGQLQLQLSEVDLVAVAREGVSRMAEEFSRAGCEVHVEAERPVVGLWDRLRLEQVVTNLLSNAIKYGQGRPVRVCVEAAPGLARLSVRDEGYGIPPEDQSRIFQRFQRAEGTRHIQGLGLGLWICRQIAESHGGALRVESEAGRGSLFTLELPRSEPAAP
ncbi:GAF domain-containing protein [Hyalangium sp.]|uniref:sensor histidine kinase n=1 Tax=Hyalangium sp. TaxID=2028555 RepID=UPI002D620F07|nr:GAF domain-containing protein [Hyalangium sp.]HYH98081.1 GAF domain-containing protein [Hyalangium sp.]